MLSLMALSHLFEARSKTSNRPPPSEARSRRLQPKPKQLPNQAEKGNRRTKNRKRRILPRKGLSRRSPRHQKEGMRIPTRASWKKTVLATPTRRPNLRPSFQTRPKFQTLVTPQPAQTNQTNLLPPTSPLLQTQPPNQPPRPSQTLCSRQTNTSTYRPTSRQPHTNQVQC